MHSEQPANDRLKKSVILASPRGFCAGVDRAIQIVEKSIEQYGAPIYVRHEIVHNQHVVARLEKMGAVFVEELDECPADRPVIFSAHGVPKSVPKAAEQRNIHYIDATCPLVSKVHIEAAKHHKAGRHILLIGHAGHPEVIGTMGQLEKGDMTLIQDEADALDFQADNAENLALVTQTTLSVDDTAKIIAILQERFPNIALPYKEDICYATTNRQAAVKAVAKNCDLFLVIGSQTSSNSKRLVEVARKAGARAAMLVSGADTLNWAIIETSRTIGLSAGASAPEYLTDGVLAALHSRYEVDFSEISVTDEDVTFHLPRELRR